MNKIINAVAIMNGLKGILNRLTPLICKKPNTPTIKKLINRARINLVMKIVPRKSDFSFSVS